MNSVVHAGVSFTMCPVKMRFRVIFTPKIGIYFPLTVFKDKTLCGTTITMYQMESIYLGEEKTLNGENDLILISCRKGSRPVYYTDMFDIPVCNHLGNPILGRHVNCPMCTEHKNFELWQLSKLEL